MRRVNLLVLLSLIATSLYGVSASQAAEETIDLSKRNRYALGICQSATQLDCLEPTITVTHKDGSTSIAQHVSSQFTGPFLDIKFRNTFRVHRFQVNYGSKDGPLREFEIEINFSTPSWKPFAALSIFVTGRGRLLSSDECDDVYKKICQQFTIDPEDQFSLSVRTQKLTVEETASGSRNADIVRTNFLQGDRWEFTGSQSEFDFSAMLGWSVTQLGPKGESAFRGTSKCAQFGTLFRSSNGTSQGQPYWDKYSQTLNFNVFGPHLNRAGDIYRGFFRARIPKNWLKCVDPANSLSNASRVQVAIVYDDGEKQVVTTSTKVTEQMIYVEVPEFHFSAPTIQISSAEKPAVTTLPSVSPSPNTSKISTPKAKYCTKGKEKKKMTGNKCPSGWKLVA